MTIDSRTLNQNTGVENTSVCNNYILGGAEPINWAYITRSGVSQGPANPLFTGTFANPNFTAVNPNLSKDLFMSPGDRIRIHMHDTSAGFRTDLTHQNPGRDRPCRQPPGQIPACGISAPGSCLGSWRRSARWGTGARCGQGAATSSRSGYSAPRSYGGVGSGAGASRGGATGSGRGRP